MLTFWCYIVVVKRRQISSFFFFSSLRNELDISLQQKYQEKRTLKSYKILHDGKAQMFNSETVYEI